MKPGYFVWNIKNRCKWSYTLSFSLVLLSPAVTMAFSPHYSEAVQCGAFVITWKGPIPHFNVLILPFDASPLTFMPWESDPVLALFSDTGLSHDDTTDTWKYRVDKLPLKRGAQFIVSLDYGYSALLFSRLLQFRSAHTIFLTLLQQSKVLQMCL